MRESSTKVNKDGFSNFVFLFLSPLIVQTSLFSFSISSFCSNIYFLFFYLLILFKHLFSLFLSPRFVKTSIFSFFLFFSLLIFFNHLFSLFLSCSFVRTSIFSFSISSFCSLTIPFFFSFSSPFPVYIYILFSVQHFLFTIPFCFSFLVLFLHFHSVFSFGYLDLFPERNLIKSLCVCLEKQT